MFEKTLAAQLKAIFDFDKVSFDKPGASQEQEGVFVDISQANITIKDKRAVGRVSGKIVVFAQSDKLPYGYFAKCIAAADAELTRELFFHDFEENRGTYRNIAERALSFLYLFDSQYDPAVGTITSINLSISEN